MNHSHVSAAGPDAMLIDDTGDNSLTAAFELDFTIDSLIEDADLTNSTTPMDTLLRGVDEQSEIPSSPRLSRGSSELPIDGLETHESMNGDLVAFGRPDVSAASVPGVSSACLNKLKLVSLNCQ